MTTSVRDNHNEEPTRRTVLKDADVVIHDAESHRRRADVVVNGAEIVEISDSGARRDDAGEEVIDCSGLLLMPGMVNAHTHLFQVITRGVGKEFEVRRWAKTVTYPVARELSAREYYFAALHACADAIRNGSTSVVDHSTHFARFHADESCRAILTSGLRGAVARAGCDFSLIDATEPRPLAEDLEQTASFLDRWSHHPRLQAWVGPSGFHSCSPEGLQAFKRLAEDKKVRFHMHLAESPKGRDEARQAGFLGEAHRAIKLGLADERSSFVHAIWVSDDEFRLLADQRCNLVHCATSNQIVASGIANFRKMRDSHIRVALATDGASSNDSLDMITEMKAATLLSRVSHLDANATHARDVFSAATDKGACLLGHDKLGKIQVGYLADIVGLRLRDNPSLSPCTYPVESVVYCGSGRDVCLVMVDGAVVYRDGVFSFLDPHEVIHAVEVITKRLVH